MYALSEEHEVFLLGWDRESSGEDIRHEKHSIHGKEFDYYLIPEPAKFGGGMKSMVGPMRRFWKRAYKWLSENQGSYDALHVVNFDTAKPAFKAARKFGKKTVYDIFDYYADSYNAPGIVKSCIRNLENNYISKADMTIICSEERKHQISGSAPKKLIVVENTPENIAVRDDFELDPKSDPDKPKVVYAGMLVFDRFLKETAKVMMQRNDIEWHVAGYGVLRPFIEECAAEHDNIFYYGPLPYDDILALEKKCDIMTALQNPSVPNNRYSAPNKFYEALFLGKPVIMGKNGTLYNEIRVHGIGDVIEVIDVDVQTEIFNSMDRVLLMRDRWESMSASARNLYESKYPWSKSAKALLDGYRTILKAL